MKRAASVLVLLLVLCLALFRVSEDSTASSFVSGEIRIMPDGSVEGTSKIQRNGDVYTLVSDLDGAVENVGYFISLETTSFLTVLDEPFRGLEQELP